MLAATAQAQTPPSTTPASCKAQATEKKLHGAALNSFMKKCQTDAKASCDTSASDKKLAGAAKTSFTKKCVTDAVGQ
nr:PsiF family protein [Rhodoplanes roseus]